MPAKTPLKKKPAGKSPARSGAPKAKTDGPSKTKHNGETKAAGTSLRSELEKLRQDAAASQEKLAQLEIQIANDGDQLRAAQTKLTTREAELQAARADAQGLREQLTRAKAPAAAGTLRCPRCGSSMKEVTLETVRADKCDDCYGIFFDNGELEVVLKHHDEQRDKGARHWYSGLFGRK